MTAHVQDLKELGREFDSLLEGFPRWPKKSDKPPEVQGQEFARFSELASFLRFCEQPTYPYGVAQ